VNPDDKLHKENNGNCRQCHIEKAWLPATFKHEKYFRFDREHNTKCETCHINNDYANYTCYGCHEHTLSKIREEHIEEGILNYKICVECHRSGDEDEAEHIWETKRFEVRKLKAFNASPYYNRKDQHYDDDD